MNAKKKKLRIKWKTTIPAIICVILFLYLIISLIVTLFSGSSKDIDIYKIGDLNGKKTLEVINKEDRSNPVEVKDYNFYGESLNLYFDTYSLSISRSNTLNGKTVVLKDLLDENNVIEFADLTNKIDDQIDLGKLNDGFYSVYLKDGETLSRLYYSSIISYDNYMYTVRRNGTSKKVEIIADKTLFDQEGSNESVLDNNYIYIKVSTATDEENTQYDFAISTAPALVYDGVSLVGVEDNGIVEAQELYELATNLKTALEAKGFKVLILKDEYDQDISYYGTNGVLYKAYNSKAKYMIHLDMDEYGNKALLYSTKSSGKLAKGIFDSLMSSTTLYESTDYLSSCDLADDDINDSQYEIREAGGVVLAAGTYSESSQQNASFASNNKFGIDTIEIITTNINDVSDVTNWLENKTKAVDAIVNGILAVIK